MPSRLLRILAAFLLIPSLSLLSYAQESNARDRLRVACIGASNTYGHGIPDREHNSYPAQLQKRLGESYDVRNFGVSGATMLKHGDSPYWKKPQFDDALKFNPNVVVINLFGNDSKPQNWKFKDELSGDTQAMMRAFADLPAHPRILLAFPMPAFQTMYGINEAVLSKEIIPILRQLAFETGTELIDLRTPMLDKGDWFADHIHPNAEGARLMAKVIGDVISFPAANGYNIETTFKEQGFKTAVKSFFGYRQLSFTLPNGRECTVVRPYRTAASKPYVWRGEFFGHEPQADLALLERGYHVVYVNAQNMYGSPEAMGIWEQVRDVLAKAGLDGKIVLIGMSRGGLYCYNWAARHPETVAVLYGDNPVCTFFSWPGGTGRETTSKNEWLGLIKTYGFKDEAEALAYDKNPVDNLKPLADAHIPIIHVVGEADKLVPVATNTNILEERYKALGGEILVIRKPGMDHHPHSLVNPQPIIDFIEAHSK